MISTLEAKNILKNTNVLKKQNKKIINIILTNLINIKNKSNKITKNQFNICINMLYYFA